MSRRGEAVAQAEREVREAEVRIDSQAAIAEGFELAGDQRAAEQAKETLAILRTVLALALLYLAVERAWPEHEPSRHAR